MRTAIFLLTWIFSFFFCLYQHTPLWAVDAAEQAKQLKMEGTALQLRGQVAEAVKKYRESLALQPDEKLERLVNKLEPSQGGTAKLNKTPVPSAPLAPMGKQVAAPQPAEDKPSDVPPPVVIGTEPPLAHIDDTFGQHRLIAKLLIPKQGGVVKGSESEVYLNLGQAHGVREGQLFKIVRREASGYPEPLATVKTSQVQEKFSICTIKFKFSNELPKTGDEAYEVKNRINNLIVCQLSYNQRFNLFTKNLQEKLIEIFVKEKPQEGLQVVEKAQLEKVLEEQHVGYSGLTNIKSARKIGALLGAEAILVGIVDDTGEAITLKTNIISVETGNTLSSGEVTLQKTPSIKQLLDNAIEEGEEKNGNLSLKGKNNAEQTSQPPDPWKITTITDEMENTKTQVATANITTGDGHHFEITATCSPGDKFIPKSINLGVLAGNEKYKIYEKTNSYGNDWVGYNSNTQSLTGVRIKFDEGGIVYVQAIANYNNEFHLSFPLKPKNSDIREPSQKKNDIEPGEGIVNAIVGVSVLLSASSDARELINNNVLSIQPTLSDGQTPIIRLPLTDVFDQYARQCVFTEQ